MTGGGLGARGVYVEWAAGAFIYRYNPTSSTTRGRWREVVHRYAAIGPAQVGALIDAAARWRKRRGVLGTLAGLGVATLVAFGTENVLPALVAGGVAGVAASLLTQRRAVALTYDLEDGGQRAFLDQLAAASSALRSTGAMAVVWSNSCATPSLPSVPTFTTSDGGSLPFTLNLSAPCWRASEATLIFLPDRVSVVTSGGTAFVDYGQLRLSHGAEDILVEGAAPGDATVLQTQWRHMTKAGGPDRRYRDNPMLHFVRYGWLRLEAGPGFTLTLRTNRLAAASEAFVTLQRVLQAHPSVWSAPTSSPLAPPLPPSPTPPSQGWQMNHAGTSAMVPTATPWMQAAMPSPPPAVPRSSPSPPLASSSPRASSPQQHPPSPVFEALLQFPDPALQQEVIDFSSGAGSSARRPGRPTGGEHARGVFDFSSARDPGDDPPTVAPPAPAATFALPPPAPATTYDRAQWIRPGEVVEVHGRSIRGGLLYVGERFMMRKEQTEPSLVRPSLPVAPTLDWEGASIGYWPSYASLNHAQRATYLEWLSLGRRDPRAAIGYVFIFFYGLERRAFSDPACTAEDLALARDEVLALREIYERHPSFAAYSSSFLDALDLRMGSTRREPPGTVQAAGDDALLWLRVELSRREKAQAPLDATWALAWHDAVRPKGSPTVRVRCDVEVRALFARRYRERFGDGVVPARGRTRLKAEYLPASNALDRPITLAVEGLTEVSRGPAAERTLDEIGEVLQRCVEELTPYSRWLGRNPEGRGSVAALALLPADLATERSDASGAVVRAIEALLDGRPRAVLRGQVLLERLAVTKGSKPGKIEVIAAIQLLEKLGFGVEPDARFRGALLSPDRDAVLFRLTAGAPASPSPAYEAATLFAQLAAVMSTVDGSIGEEERRHAEEHIEHALKLDAAERARIAAHLDLLLLAPPGASSLKKRLANVPQDARQALAAFLVGVAGADGRIDPAEVKLLRKLYPLLGLEADLVYKHLHALSTPGRSAPPPRGEGSGPSGSIAPPNAFELDMEKVRETLAQTDAVSSLLGSIFAEPEEAGAPPPAPPATPQPTVAGLDPAHSGLLLALARSPSWARRDFERETARWGLLPDGALEALNEKAFDRCGAPLCEGDDPIVLDEQVAREMIDE